MTTATITGEAVKTHLYKACQRCGGDLVLDREEGYGAPDGSDYVCLQCGRHTPLQAFVNARAQATARAA